METTDNCKGWLTKSPPLDQASTKSRWKRRYFCLDNKARKLHYSEKENDKPKKSIDLKESEKLKKYDSFENYGEKNAPFLEKHQSENIICLTTKERIYFLTADNKEDMERWYLALKKSLMQIGCISDKDEEENIDDRRHTYNGPAAEDRYSKFSIISAPGVLENQFSSGASRGGYDRQISSSESSGSLASYHSAKSYTGDTKQSDEENDVVKLPIQETHSP